MQDADSISHARSNSISNSGNQLTRIRYRRASNPSEFLEPQAQVQDFKGKGDPHGPKQTTQSANRKNLKAKILGGRFQRPEAETGWPAAAVPPACEAEIRITPIMGCAIKTGSNPGARQ